MTQSAEFSRNAQELRSFLQLELAKRRHEPPSSEWYTQPLHKTVTFNQSQTVDKSPEQGPTPVAAEYFPVTMQAELLDTNGVPGSALAPRSPTRRPGTAGASRSPTGRPGTAGASRSPTGRRRVVASTSRDNVCTILDEMPITAASTVVLSTPYQVDLAKLRLDRLRIEEDHLLEVKRLEELERIRGPVPKWYELKSPEFHYEAHKNTELVKRRHDYQALYDYRMRLVRASRNFEIQRETASS